MGRPLKKPVQNVQGQEASASVVALPTASALGHSGAQPPIVTDLPTVFPITAKEVALLRAFLRNEIQQILDSES